MEWIDNLIAITILADALQQRRDSARASSRLRRKSMEVSGA